jgi:hypothetical protein
MEFSKADILIKQRVELIGNSYRELKKVIMGERNELRCVDEC